MSSYRFSLLVTGALAAAVAALAQSTSATNRPNPPAPPRADAPGSPVNPQQASTPQAAPIQAAPAASSQAALPANQVPPDASEPEARITPLRELNFGEADVDGDKRVTLTEYARYVGSRDESRGTEPITEELIERFRQLDQDNDAALTENESRATPPAAQPYSPPAPAASRPRRG